MTRLIEGTADGSGLHVGIAVASWNQAITDRLLQGATRRCAELGVGEVTVLRVPGALELPLAALKLIDHGCHGVVALGVAVKGETDHYDIVIRESAAGLAKVALDTSTPVANSILAVHDIRDALERAQDGEVNKGVEGVDALIRTITAIEGLRRL